ncbi:MAG: NADH-quinone oxidoreductase subunit G, partial [Actinomycetota bacterium]|nr:NADH-quinone oxidoreductase subunit G [Actinomycetota bacterium]
GALSDHRVLHVLADEMDRPIGLPDVASARAEISELGAAPTRAEVLAGEPVEVERTPGDALLSTWHLLLDDGSLQDGEPFLAGTAKQPVALLSSATAAGLGATAGDLVTVSTDRGSVSLPLVLGDLPDGVVWLPTRSSAAHVRTDLVAAHGSVVRLAKGGSQ